MDDLERLVAERECTRLTHRYCRFADFGQASRLAELFTQDGVFSLPGLLLTGRAQIRSAFAQREALADLRTAHLCSTIDVEVDDRHSARGFVHLSLHRRWSDEGSAGPAVSSVPALIAAYEDEYTAVAGQWLIASRIQHVLFEDPEDPGWTRPGRHH